MKNKKIYYFIFTLLFFILLIFILSNNIYAAEPKLVKTITKAFEKIKDWVLKIATPAAAVAVATGIFMKKFSFGDEERIRIGKKLVRNSLFSYAFLLSIDLILGAIESLI